MKQSSKFTLAGHRVTVDLEIVTRAGKGQTVDLTPAPETFQRLSLQATIKGPSGYHGGQAGDTLRQLGAHVPDVVRLCDLWARWHLNDMRAGTRAQLAALVELKPDGGADQFAAYKAALASKGLDPDTETGAPLAPPKGYAYGSAWLLEPLPAEVGDELAAILTRLNGAKFGEAEGPREVEEIAAALGLTVESTFFPFSQSRKARGDDDGQVRPSLNWKCRLFRPGPPDKFGAATRVCVLEVDYTAGSGHAPAAKATSGALRPSGLSDQVARERLLAWECENGRRGGWSTLRHEPGPYVGRGGGPILPDPADVIAALAMDSDVLQSSGFADWAAEFGYDADSIKAKATFDACLEIALKLKAAIGEAALTELRDAAHAR